MKRIIKIVLTGGVCSGKTTCEPYVRKYAKLKNIGLIWVPETATKLVNAGKDLRKSGNIYLFQNAVFEEQLKAEQSSFKQAEKCSNNVVLIILDRGVVDTYGYLCDKDADKLVASHNMTKNDLLSRYDCVIHLVTVAKGAAEFYNTSNNARTENTEEAIALDEKIANAWSDHPNRFVIGNGNGFEHKMNQLIEIIDSQIK